MTLKEIAELAGVSRGTVDRVINRRGRVSAETEEHVREILETVNYRPNKAGKALAAIRKPVKFGVILSGDGNPFFEEVFRGIEDAGNELKDFGVEILFQSMKGYDVEKQLYLMDDLVRQGVCGIAFAPIDDPRIVRAIDDLEELRIAVISLNQDVTGSKRRCYIGSDYWKCGSIAAGLIGKMKHNAQVAIVIGTLKMMGHRQRVEGFQSTLKAHYPEINVLAVAENNDDDDLSHSVVQKILAEYPELSAIFFGAAGTSGGIRAIQESGRKQIIIICVDATPSIREYLRTGWVDAAIYQHPYEQGYKAIRLLYDNLINEIPIPEEYIMVDNEIYIPESIC